MPEQETLLIVILAAMGANLVLGIALLLVPRLRQGASGDEGRPLPREDARRGRAARPDERPPHPLFQPALPALVQADPQTGLDVPTTWVRWLREEDARIRRYRRSATVVLVEIDGLDRLVDRLGAEAGERILPPVATTLRRHAREADRVARLGPGRFAVLLPETAELQSAHYIERVREACDRWLQAGAVSLRLAIGHAEANAGRSLEVAQQVAEERLNVERRRDQPVAWADGADGTTRTPV